MSSNTGVVRVQARRFALCAAILLAGISIAGVHAQSAQACCADVTCNAFSSGDVCWVDYYTAYQMVDGYTQSQYGRNQVCAKARDSIVSGPVSPGSACISNTNFGYADFTYPSVYKKAYGYWAGAGGPIWVIASAFDF
jgi:hypothetical protein